MSDSKQNMKRVGAGAHLTFWHVSERHTRIAQAFKPGIALISRASSPEGTLEFGPAEFI
jgi:hypothetical protein